MKTEVQSIRTIVKSTHDAISYHNRIRIETRNVRKKSKSVKRDDDTRQKLFPFALNTGAPFIKKRKSNHRNDPMDRARAIRPSSRVNRFLLFMRNGGIASKRPIPNWKGRRREGEPLVVGWGLDNRLPTFGVALADSRKRDTPLMRLSASGKGWRLGRWDPFFPFCCCLLSFRVRLSATVVWRATPGSRRTEPLITAVGHWLCTGIATRQPPPPPLNHMTMSRMIYSRFPLNTLSSWAWERDTFLDIGKSRLFCFIVTRTASIRTGERGKQNSDPKGDE